MFPSNQISTMTHEIRDLSDKKKNQLTLSKDFKDKK